MLPTQDKKEAYVKNMFARIATQYDKLNDIMTFFLHKGWKRKTVDLCQIKNKNAQVLDLCTGTGDMAFYWARNPQVTKIVGLDSCGEMLDIANDKLNKTESKLKGRLEFVNGDALKLPFEDNSFDAVTVGFGLRNVVDLKGSLVEIKRVLKPGGVIASLDLGHPPIAFINQIYRTIFLKIIPSLGAKFAKDKSAYEYLVESLESWPSQKDLSQKFWDLGFSRSYFIDLALGSVAIVVAEK